MAGDKTGKQFLGSRGRAGEEKEKGKGKEVECRSQHMAGLEHTGREVLMDIKDQFGSRDWGDVFLG